VRVHEGKALLAGLAALALGLTACSSSGGGGNATSGAASSSGGASSSSSSSGNGGAGTGAFQDCSANPNTCNSGDTKPGGTIRYTIEKTIDGWNLNFSEHNVFDYAEVLDGILPPVFNASPDLKPFLNQDLMVSADSSTKGGKQTIVYKVNPDAVWSDGQPIGYDDFKYMWDFSDPSHCKNCGPSSTAGYTEISDMKSSDNGKTITVTLKHPFADWQSMFGSLMPAHLAKEHGYDGSSAGIEKSFKWFDENVPDWSGGPMLITKYQKDQAVTETPNPKWYGKTKSSLDSLIFRIITDQTQEVPALQNGEVDAIYPQPNTDVLQAVQSVPDTQYFIGKGLIWEHYNLNEKNPFLSDKPLRQAIFTAVNRQDIIDRTIGQFVPNASPTGNHIYVPGQPGYQDNTSAAGQGQGNLDAAKKLLTDAGYKGVGSSLKTPDGKTVTLSCTYSEGNAYRQTECEIMQQTLKELGVSNVKLRTTADLSELDTGNYDIIVFAWVGTPYPVAGAQQIYTFGGGTHFAYTYNKDAKVEDLINQAFGTTDQNQVQSLLNQADKLMQTDAFELPLYQKPTFLAAKTNIVNIRDNATSVGPPYNVQEWGIKAT
jgi:peptide/nickel transport system substrate-binding protein